MPHPALSRVGCYGKLPARGDFVRAGLPRSFTDPWDAWVQAVLPASRECLGAAWEPAWLAAPVWQFRLAPGVCGPEAALGVWLASVDRVGRYFPLVLAGIGVAGDGFLAEAARIGLAAIAADWPPEAVAAGLRAAPAEAGEAVAGTLWWSEGGRLALAGMPDAATFAAMLASDP